jgi:hypothetical protein
MRVGTPLAPVLAIRGDLSTPSADARLSAMEAEIAPARPFSSHLRRAFGACRGAWSRAAKLALDIALPTLCVACREPVDGDGVCAQFAPNAGPS